MIDRVPAGPFVPYIEEWIASHDFEESPLQALAERIGGTSYGALWNVLYGDQRTMPFRVADGLLAAVDKPEDWSSPELSEIYYGTYLPEQDGAVCRNKHPREYTIVRPNGAKVCTLCRSEWKAQRKKVAA